MIPDVNRIVQYSNNSEVFDKLNKNLLANKLKIIHFNDVYNIEESKNEPCGGAARFAYALDYITNNDPHLILFSGDALSPSSCRILLFSYLLISNFQFFLKSKHISKRITND